MLPNGDNQHQRSKFNEFFNRWPPEDPLNVAGRVHWAPKRNRWSQMCLLGHSRTTGLTCNYSCWSVGALSETSRLVRRVSVGMVGGTIGAGGSAAELRQPQRGFVNRR